MPHNRWMAVDRHHPLLRAMTALAAMVAAMLTIAALGEWVLVPSATVTSLDEGGVARATSLLAGHPGRHDAAVAWAAASGPWVVHPVVLLVTLVLHARGRVTARALLVPVIGALGWALGSWCKVLVERPRPAEASVEVGSWSYPSGHSTNIALGAVLLLALLTTVRTAWTRRVGTLLVLACVALTAADRLVLGVHYPSDVLAGLVLGTAMALLGLLLLRPLPSPSPSASP